VAGLHHASMIGEALNRFSAGHEGAPVALQDSVPLACAATQSAVDAGSAHAHGQGVTASVRYRPVPARPTSTELRGPAQELRPQHVNGVETFAQM